MRPTVLLFDVDGTLIDATGVGRRALTRTFAARYGTSIAFEGIRFHGMTDPAIVRAALTAMGMPADAATIDAILVEYLGHLADEVARADRLRAHAGVVATLDAVAGWSDCALGLGTGNIRAGARMKLDRIGLSERFAFGGFGCDHEDRPTLLHIGAARGAARLGTSLDACRVVVIGDTPLDIAAAGAIGAECVAVGTSGIDVPTLAAAGATHAFADLTAPGVLDALRG